MYLILIHEFELSCVSISSSLFQNDLCVSFYNHHVMYVNIHVIVLCGGGMCWSIHQLLLVEVWE